MKGDSTTSGVNEQHKSRRCSGFMRFILACHGYSLAHFSLCRNIFGTLCARIFTMSTDKPLYWAVFRQQADHHMYFELEFLGRNRWQVVVGTEEFILRTKEKDFLTVLQLAISEAQSRSAQDLPDE